MRYPHNKELAQANSIIHFNIYVMPRYSKGSNEKFENDMHEMHEESHRSGSGNMPRSPKQAISYGLSEDKEEGERMPGKTGRKGTAKRAVAKKAIKGTAKSYGLSEDREEGERMPGRSGRKGTAKRAVAKKAI